MSVIHPGLFLVMRLFPFEKNAVRRLYLSSCTFRALCRDYQVCANALTYWRQSSEDRALERYCEYQELLQSLEQEIEEVFEKQTVYCNPRPQ